MISDAWGLSIFLGSLFLLFLLLRRPPARARLRGGAILLHLHRERPLTLQGGCFLLLPFRVFCLLGTFRGVLGRIGRDEVGGGWRREDASYLPVPPTFVPSPAS